MTGFTIALSFLSALSWSGFDFSRRLLVQKIRPVPLTVLVMMGQIPFFLIWALTAREFSVAPGYLTPAALSFLLNIAANMLFLWSIQVSAFSSVIPMLAFSPVFVAGFAYLALGEQPSHIQGLGIALVCAGALVFHFNRQLLKVEKGVWGMLLVALLWALAAGCDKAALRFATPPMHAFLQCGAIAGGALLIALLKGQQGDLKHVTGELRMFCASVLLASLALGLQFHVFRMAYIGLYEVIKRSVGMGSSLALGTLFFQEKITARKVSGLVLMAGGVALVLSQK